MEIKCCGACVPKDERWSCENESCTCHTKEPLKKDGWEMSAVAVEGSGPFLDIVREEGDCVVVEKEKLLKFIRERDAELKRKIEGMFGEEMGPGLKIETWLRKKDVLNLLTEEEK